MSACLALLRRLVSGEHGAAMVEFAVVVPLLITLACGVIDFGRAFYVYNALSAIARDGARLGAAQGASADAALIKSRIRTVIVPQYLRSGTPAPSDANVSVTVTGNAGAGDVVVAIQNYAFQPWLPILPIARSLVMTTRASFRREPG